MCPGKRFTASVLDIPSEALLALKAHKERAEETLCMAAAAKLFEVVDELAVGRMAGVVLPNSTHP